MEGSRGVSGLGIRVWGFWQSGLQLAASAATTTANRNFHDADNNEYSHDDRESQATISHE